MPPRRQGEILRSRGLEVAAGDVFSLPVVIKSAGSAVRFCYEVHGGHECGFSVRFVDNDGVEHELIPFACRTAADALKAQKCREQERRTSDLVEFYRRHNPTKVKSAAKIVSGYSLAAVIEGLQREYGALPPSWDADAAELDRQRAQLESFYAEHNPPKVKGVAKLLMQYSFESIRASLSKEYGALPEGWEFEGPLRGRFALQEPGTVHFTWDNHRSRMGSRKITYRVSIEPTDELDGARRADSEHDNFNSALDLYEVDAGVSLNLRSDPSTTSGRRLDVRLEPGTQFEVCETVKIPKDRDDGGDQFFLKLANGSGWAFQLHPKTGRPVCRLVTRSSTPVTALSSASETHSNSGKRPTLPETPAEAHAREQGQGKQSNAGSASGPGTGAQAVAHRGIARAGGLDPPGSPPPSPLLNGDGDGDDRTSLVHKSMSARKAAVAARSKLEVPLPIRSAGTVVKWAVAWADTEAIDADLDIGLKVHFMNLSGNAIEVKPEQRLKLKKWPDAHQGSCQLGCGTCIVTFDNTHSWLKKKNIVYAFDLLEGDGPPPGARSPRSAVASPGGSSRSQGRTPRSPAAVPPATPKQKQESEDNVREQPKPEPEPQTQTQTQTQPQPPLQSQLQAQPEQRVETKSEAESGPQVDAEPNHERDEGEPDAAEVSTDEEGGGNISSSSSDSDSSSSSGDSNGDIGNENDEDNGSNHARVSDDCALDQTNSAVQGDAGAAMEAIDQETDGREGTGEGDVNKKEDCSNDQGENEDDSETHHECESAPTEAGNPFDDYSFVQASSSPGPAAGTESPAEPELKRASPEAGADQEDQVAEEVYAAKLARALAKRDKKHARALARLEAAHNEAVEDINSAHSASQKRRKEKHARAISDVEGQLAQSKDALEAAQTALSESQAACAEMLAVKTELQAKLAKHEDAATAQSSEVASLAQARTELQNVLESSAAQLRACEADHKAALEAADEKCRAQAEEHAAAVAALEAKCGAMQQDLQCRQQIHDDVVQKHEAELTLAVQDVKKELSAQLAACDAAHKEDLAATVADYEQRLQHHTAAKGDYQAQLDALQEANQQLEKKSAADTKILEALRAQKDETVEALQEQLEAAEAEAQQQRCAAEERAAAAAETATQAARAEAEAATAAAAEEFARQRQHMHQQHEAAQEQQRATHQAVLVQHEEEQAVLEAKLQHALRRAEAAETPLLSISLRPMLLPVRAKGSNANTLTLASPPPLLLRHGMRLGRSDFCEDYTSADSAVSRAHVSVEIGDAGEVVLQATAANAPYVMALWVLAAVLFTAMFLILRSTLHFAAMFLQMHY
eukprot:g2515.t1